MATSCAGQCRNDDPYKLHRKPQGLFLACVRAGQTDGTITRVLPPETLVQNLLGVLMGIRVLARVRPERALLEGVATAALALRGG